MASTTLITGMVPTKREGIFPICLSDIGWLFLAIVCGWLMATLSAHPTLLTLLGGQSVCQEQVEGISA